VRRDLVKGVIPNVYYQSVNTLDPTAIQFERDVYNCFDLIGDLGGVSGVFISLFGFICYPYSKFAYNLKVSKELFKARTKDKKMFAS
jgi:hypothetical protein